MEDENYLVTVEPAEPLTGVDGTEGTPELKQSSVTSARREDRERGREREMYICKQINRRSYVYSEY